jgi:hypothetical protein
MQSKKSRHIEAALVHRVGPGAGSTRIADVVVQVWTDIDIALRPILGAQGVAALYERSLHRTTGAATGLVGSPDMNPRPMDLTALAAALAGQSDEEALANGGELLQTFHDLLVTLVGPLLTERLLRSVWTEFSGDPPEQDTSP